MRHALSILVLGLAFFVVTRPDGRRRFRSAAAAD